MLNKNRWLLYLIVFISSCMKQEQAYQIEIGHALFFDKNLSVNHSRSCASCHDPHYAFTDGYRTSITPRGEPLKHNAPSLLNTQSFAFYDWDNLHARNYESQMNRPLFNRHPMEMGLDEHWDSFKQYVCKTKYYSERLSPLMDDPETDLTPSFIKTCLTQYLEQIKSRNAPIDHYLAGNEHAISLRAKRGLKLFMGNKLKCGRCHMLPDFTSNTRSENPDSIFFNTGLYNMKNTQGYPEEDNGIRKYTKNPDDDGKFRVPGLRNVMLTAPYMHDGSVATIQEVLEIYKKGGRVISSGPYTGDGATHPSKDPRISGFRLSKNEERDVILFLESLTDTSYLQKEIFLNPFHSGGSN